jgi:hypothetical protein
MCNGGGTTPSYNYRFTFTFTDGNSGDHTFHFRLLTYDYNGGSQGDEWLDIPYSI